MDGVILYLAFRGQLISVSIMSSRFIHVVVKQLGWWQTQEERWAACSPLEITSVIEKHRCTFFPFFRHCPINSVKWSCCWGDCEACFSLSHVLELSHSGPLCSLTGCWLLPESSEVLGNTGHTPSRLGLGELGTVHYLFYDGNSTARLCSII